MDLKDITIRAVKTFLQAFLAVLAAGIINVTDVSSLQALAVAGLAGGLSALQNFIRDTL